LAKQKNFPGTRSIFNGFVIFFMAAILSGNRTQSREKRAEGGTPSLAHTPYTREQKPVTRVTKFSPHRSGTLTAIIFPRVYTMWRKGKDLMRSFKRELRIYQSVLADSRTPIQAKIFLGLAVGYLCMPFDLIPDFIPFVGHLDDVIIVPALVYVALRFIPPELVNEHRNALKAS
jgi:uncharacterized membrane protein YkvA (DUF1232 family)